METTMRLAIETYAEISGRTFESVLNDLANENKVMIDIIMKMMFCVAR